MIYRIHKTRDYTVMSNHHLKDNRISNKAKGLLTTMLSLPDDWNYSVNGLATLSTDGRDAVASALMELETYGYLVRSQARENGQFVGYEYDIYEKPITENPTTENHAQLNTNKSNTYQIDYPMSEIRAYCSSKGVDGDAFITYYSQRDWVIGGEPIKNWKKVVDAWASKPKKNGFSNFEGRKGTDYKAIEKAMMEK